jgi:hypothetical protein
MRKALFFTLLAVPICSFAASPPETVDKAIQAMGGNNRPARSPSG